MSQQFMVEFGSSRYGNYHERRKKIDVPNKYLNDDRKIREYIKKELYGEGYQEITLLSFEEVGLIGQGPEGLI